MGLLNREPVFRQRTDANGISPCETVGGDVLVDNASRRDDGVITDSHTFQNDAPRTDETGFPDVDGLSSVRLVK